MGVGCEERYSGLTALWPATFCEDGMVGSKCQRGGGEEKEARWRRQMKRYIRWLGCEKEVLGGNVERSQYISPQAVAPNSQTTTGPFDRQKADGEWSRFVFACEFSHLPTGAVVAASVVPEALRRCPNTNRKTLSDDASLAGEMQGLKVLMNGPIGLERPKNTLELPRPIRSSP